MGFWETLSRLLRMGRPPQSSSPQEQAPTAPSANRQIQVFPTAGHAASPVAAPLQPIDFLPISREELVKGGEEVRRTTGWMWFGRRDIIPPASDPRTKLIDRGMLTQGLLTADELAEMHTVGDQYGKFANREHHIEVQAGQSAEQAVEADRAARKVVKERKKAEAAERKKKRQEAIVFRKANDIRFIGRRVVALERPRE